MALTKVKSAGVQSIETALPAGCVIQTVSSSFQTRLNIPTGANFTKATGFTASITPTSTSSKILVTCNVNIAGLSGNYSLGGRLYANDVHVSDASADNAIKSSNDEGTWFTVGYQNWSNYARYQISPQYLHSPNSTSAQEYSIYIANDHVSDYRFLINRHSYESTDVAYLYTSKSNWVLQEIKG